MIALPGMSQFPGLLRVMSGIVNQDMLNMQSNSGRNELYDGTAAPIYKSIPSCSFAASDIRSGVQGGSQTTSTFAEVTPGTVFTLICTSPGSDPATGQAGDVNVMRMPTVPSGFTSMS